MNIIKDIRTELGMTQAAFAKVSGFNKVQQVSGLENNVKGLGLFLLSKIVRHLASNGISASLDVILTVNQKKIRIH